MVWPFTQDHIIPRAQGGCNDRRNIAPACGPCNGARGDMPLVEFIERLPELVPGAQAVLPVEAAAELVVKAKAVCDAVDGYFRRK